MHSSSIDLLVAGAGPAGIAAAITAADRGLDVLVVDKARFPRHKTCGDGLTTGALRRLESLGLSLHDLRSQVEVRDVVLVGPDGRRVSMSLPADGRYAVVVERHELDAALVALARRRGVEIREDHAVESIMVDHDGAKVVLADGSSAHSRHVIAADGHYSTVRRLLDAGERDLGTWHAFRQYFGDVDEERLWVLFERDLLPGYAWVFPLPGGRANVGFGVLRGPDTTGKRLRALWRELLERPSLREVLGPRAKPEGTHRAWPIPGHLELDRLAFGPVLYAGDAAGVADPLTGEGIGQALETGALAAEAVIAGGDASAVAQRYRRAVGRALAADLRLAGALQRLVAFEAVTRTALRVIDTNDWTRRHFVRWMFEDYPRAQLLTPHRWRRGACSTPGAYRA